MSENKNTVAKVVLGLCLVLVSMLLGTLLGGTYVRFIMPPAADGWTGLADMLGGLMLGALLGLVFSLVLMGPLVRRGPAALGKAALGILAGAALIFLVLFLSRPKRPDPSPPTPPRKAFQPLFRVNVRIALNDERLRAIPTQARPIKRASYKIETYGRNGPHFDFETLGEERRACSTTLSEEDLHRVLKVLRPATALSGICRTPEDDEPISFGWRLNDVDPVSGGATVEAGCLAEKPQLLALIATLDDFADRQGTFECREL